MNKHLMERVHSDDGFMGRTHALSGVALFLVVAAFFPTLFATLLPNANWALVISAFLLTVGASLLPDFDNVRSTIISVLGIIGVGISTVMRAFARAIYSVTRSKSDKPNADPHRGFWHTIIAGLMTGFLAYLLVTTTSKVKIPIFDTIDHLGYLFLGLFILIATQVTFAIFFKSQMKKLTKGFGGQAVSWLIGLAITVLLLMNLPKVDSYLWVFVCISGGWIIHILGDTITTSGTPLLFPIKHKGHRWWNWRFPPHIKAGGPTENYVVMPALVFLIVIASAVLGFKIF